jgi:hypothetical protein
MLGSERFLKPTSICLIMHDKPGGLCASAAMAQVRTLRVPWELSEAGLRGGNLTERWSAHSCCGEYFIGSQLYLRRRHRDAWDRKVKKIAGLLPTLLKFDTEETIAAKKKYRDWAREHAGKRLAYAAVRRSNETEEPMLNVAGIYLYRHAAVAATAALEQKTDPLPFGAKVHFCDFGFRQIFGQIKMICPSFEHNETSDEITCAPALFLTCKRMVKRWKLLPSGVVSLLADFRFGKLPAVLYKVTLSPEQSEEYFPTLARGAPLPQYYSPDPKKMKERTYSTRREGGVRGTTAEITLPRASITLARGEGSSSLEDSVDSFCVEEI